MKAFLKRNKEYTFSFLIITLYLILIVFYLYINNKQFFFGNDQLYQYDVFYREWFRLIGDFFKGKGFPAYSWNLFLGSDFYSSMTYYCTGDIFVLFLFPLSFFIKSVKHLLIVETFVCFYLSAFLFIKLLKNKGIKSSLIICITAIVYAIGGWSIGYLGDYMFHRFYTFLPLLFLGIEKYYQNGKKSLIIISVFILSTQNFYMMYPTVVFMVLYCLSIELGFDKETRKQRLLKDFINISLGFLIGFMASAVILLPASLTVLNNSRLGESDSRVFWNLETYIELLLSPISSQFPIYSSYPNIFYQNDGGHSYWFVINVGIIYFINSISYALKKENRNCLFLLIVLFCIAILRPLSSIMHGFSEPSFRWLFLVQTYLLIIGSIELDKGILVNRLFAIYFILIICSIVVLLIMGFSFKEYRIHYLTLFVYLLTSFFVWLVYYKNFKYSLYLTIFVTLLFAIFNTIVKANFSNIYNRINKNEVAYYEELDDEIMYRYYIDWENVVPYSELNLNIPMDYGLMSSKTYNSMYDNTTNQFNYLNDCYMHFIDIKNPYSLNMLGTKYWIVYDEDELPSEFEFEYCYNLSDLKVYKNMNYKGFGFTLSNLDHLDNFKDFIDFEETLFIDDSNYEIDNGIKEYTRFNIIEKGNNYLKGEIDLNHDNILLIPIPNNSGWKIYVNKNLIKPISVNGGFIGIELNKGYSEIEMYFSSPGIKTGAIISLIGIIGFLLTIVKEKKLISLNKR